MKITVGRVPMRVQKCMAVDKRAGRVVTSFSSFLFAVVIPVKHAPRNITRGKLRRRNFLPCHGISRYPEIVRLQFLSVPGFDTYTQRSARLPRSTCIPNLHSNVSHRRLGLSSNVLSSSCRDFFASFSLFFSPRFHASLTASGLRNASKSHYYRDIG